MASRRLRELCEELGYAGSKTIFDDYVREIRPRYRPLPTYRARGADRRRLALLWLEVAEADHPGRRGRVTRGSPTSSASSHPRARASAAPS